MSKKKKIQSKVVRLSLYQLVKLPLPKHISVFQILPMILTSKEILNFWINFNKL